MFLNMLYDKNVFTPPSRMLTSRVTMHAIETEGETRVVLYTRNELPPPAEEQCELVYSRLQELADVSDIERTEWDKRTPVDGCDTDLRDTYLAFTNWASETGRELTPFFRTRECYTPEQERHTDWLVMPALCLAVYDDGNLTAVYPHTDGTETKTVEDGVDELERRSHDSSDHQTVLAD